jgi:formylglycine-generating enzyme required for sulfatase activity
MNPADLRAEFDFLNDDGGGKAYRFLRGASWFNHLERDLRSDYRNPGKYPDSRFPNVGFRCVLHLGDAQDPAFHV